MSFPEAFFDDGPGFLAIAILTIAAGVGFSILGRYFFRFVLLLLDQYCNKSIEEESDSLYSGAADGAMNQRRGSADAGEDDG